jgi:putative transposase
MSRPLRLHFRHAIYHVINRGNYRHPIFGTVGAAEAFEQCLFEAAALHHWRLHAFVIMNNHFHLALETPEANLTESVHWLESTYATRFNRYRKERGHVFQGRYHAPLVQPGPSLLRVVNYIHLTPARARQTDVAGLPAYRWSSLHWYLGSNRPVSLSCSDWLAELSLPDDSEGWRAYGRLLVAIATDPARQKQDGFGTMSRGWAIGDEDWRQEMAATFDRRGMAEAPCGPERDAIRQESWRQALDRALQGLGRGRNDLRIARKGADWKIALAECLQRTAGANYRWLATELHLGKTASARFLVWRLRQNMRDAIRSDSDAP